MTEKKIIAVVGATGGQGGGLVRAIQRDSGGMYRARALTRNVDSEKARELAALGAEVVAANVDDASSLARAFAGAHGAYCVTFYWEHSSPEKELAHAKAMAEAAKSAGVKHAIWSSLEDTRLRVPLTDDRMPTLMGKYKVPHLDAKGEANHYFTDLGIPTTILLTAFYWENLIFFGMAPKRGPGGKLVFALPMGDKKLPGIGVEDIGGCAYGIFQKGEEFIGRTVGIAGGHPTGAQMASSLSRALGEEVEYAAVPFAVYRALGFPGADDLGNMFQYKHDFEESYCEARDLRATRALYPGIKTFDSWLASNKERIPVE